MIEIGYDGSLEGLFSVLEGLCRGVLGPGPPDRIRRETLKAPGPPELFCLSGSSGDAAARGEEALRFCEGPLGCPPAEKLFELSAAAYGHFLYGWMSELPIETDLIRFAWRVIAAARSAGDLKTMEARTAAETAARDRGDPAAGAVLDAAYKTGREIHRLMGFLRFDPVYPGAGGIPAGTPVYLARCAPDHLVLPALARHFCLRFGETPWVIVDENRALALFRPPGAKPRFLPPEALPSPLPAGNPENSWEELWRRYHRSVTNEDRKNPQLQRRFMPGRYRKYLPECGD